MLNFVPIGKIMPNQEQNGSILKGDVIGKIQPATRNGDIYFYLFVDKTSGYMRAYTSKTKMVS
jgi:hypothetical protein